MSQVTNLNVSPYFDDFDANNDYHKVLFKPGYPIQARELTTLQSILQNQVERFGQHFFKEGAKVIPGNTTYNQFYYAVELNNTYLGVPLDAYVEQIIGSKITGETSGVTAIVEQVLLSSDSERGNVTLYLNYLSSSSSNNSTSQFLDAENLICDKEITSGLLGNTVISSGSPFAITIASNATSVGSAFSISEGVYFIRGYFVNVNSETLILDQYTNKPNYRIGLFVNEEIINSEIDEQLNDNSQGFNNYAAPGADRLKISTSLFKKDLTDFNDNNFIELATIVDGVIRTNRVNKDYSLFQDELARRTYAESGDYYVKPFDVNIKESLNDNLGNRGIFNVGQFTYGGSTPSENLAVYQISPGKAFVRGYEIETTSPVFLDVLKPRTTASLNNISINYNTGSTLVLNRVYGSPTIGIGNTYILSLRDERVGSSSTTAPGKEIGVARVYDFRLESGAYDVDNLDLNRWNISLYDIQTTTEITLNEPITLSTPAFLKGSNSGATGFLKNSVTNSSSIVLYQTNGEFLPFESFIIDGVNNTRVATAVTSYNISDVKSVYGVVGSAKTFTANTVQSNFTSVGIATISSSSGGISTVTSTNPNFPQRSIKVGNIVKYSNNLSSNPVYAKVVGIAKSSISIASVTPVVGINQGSLPNSTLNVSDFTILTTKLARSGNSELYTVLPKPNISSIDLDNSTITIRKTYPVSISDNRLSTPVIASENEIFLPFDEERYTLSRSDGTVEVLTSDKVRITNGTSLQIYNLGSNDTGATLTVTIKKSKPKSKIKLKNRVSSIVIDKSSLSSSGIGSTTLNDGLTFGNYPYGTRVQDETISLNTPDIINVLGVYESSTATENPSAPLLTLSSISGATSSTTDLLIGELFTGEISGAIGVCLERETNSKISYVSINENIFREGETISFSESNVQAVITDIDSPSNNISASFRFDNGQKSSYYGYGQIIRTPSSPAPTKKIKVYYSSAYYDSSDDGDITTIQSYNTFDYKREIQVVNSIRNSDIIDIRPRVSNYVTTEGSLRSPLEFYGRTFSGSGDSAANILASDEDIVTSISYYIGRIDRIYLRKDGTFQVKYGVPAERPQKPVTVDDALEIATVSLPPYLFDVSQSSIQFLDYKRYRMSDINNLENRIKNLEYYTALSILETNTSSLYISDSEGLDRFKSGFFVDNFTSFISQENNFSFENSLDIENKELRPRHFTTSIDLVPGPVQNTNPQVDKLFEVPEGINIRKTGGLITLDYSDSQWLQQNQATRTENVTPFVISFWQGSIELTPSSDTWMDTNRIDAKIINTEGNYTETLSVAAQQYNVDPQTGYSPVIWNAWETTWTGTETIRDYDLTISSSQSSSTNSNTENRSRYYTDTDIDYRTYYDSSTESTTTTETQVNEYYKNPYWYGWPYWGYWGYWGWYRGGGYGYGTEQTTNTLTTTNATASALTTATTTTLSNAFQETNTSSTSSTTINLTQDTYTEVKETGFKTRTGTTTLVTEQFDKSSVGDKVISRDLVQYLRSRNIQFISKNLKPLTQIYAFFDGVDVTSYCVPKLLEITMVSGVFQVGETVIGRQTRQVTNRVSPSITFRVAQSDHKEGPYNNPTSTYTINPYTNSTIQSTYSSTSNILNIDTFSLCAQYQADYSGWVEPTMTLTGKTSGAIATITNVRLVSDNYASLIGSFFIPDPDIATNPRFESGIKTLTLINNQLNNKSIASTFAESKFTSSGLIETIQEQIISTRNAAITQKTQTEKENVFRTTGRELSDTETSSIVTQATAQATSQAQATALATARATARAQATAQATAIATAESTSTSQPYCYYYGSPWYDPLAQSFLVQDESGIFLTKCDIFFKTKDAQNVPITLQIRTMSGGYPTTTVVPFSEVTLNPSSVRTSENGSVATTFTFSSPVYLEGGKDYAIVLASNSSSYNVFISRVGEVDLLTQSYISNQPYLGSLFKSQNASTWEASQWEDLKFTLYRANFLNAGSVEFYNPTLGVGNFQVPKLLPNPLNLNSRRIKIGLSTSLNDSTLTFGNTILQDGTNATGNYVGNAGIATGTLRRINAGIGYTPSSGSYTYSNINLVNVTGEGRGATADVTITDGVAIAATIKTSGNGYQVGDVLRLSLDGPLNVGRNALFSLVSIASTQELILDNVQGEFEVVGAAKTVQYINNSGILTALNASSGGNVQISEINVINDGLHILVNHKNHGMYSENNYVRIGGIEPDTIPTKLTSQYTFNSTGSIGIATTANFGTFENAQVSASNPGYVLINNELFEYQAVSPSSLDVITRIGYVDPNTSEIVSNRAVTHTAGTPVYKYELGGVSLRRINTSHYLGDATILNPIALDSYYLKIKTNANGTNRDTGTTYPKLFLNQSKSAGGVNVKASQNIPFEIATPNVQNVTVTGTSLSAELRTISGSSISGSEIPFLDQGFETITLNKANYLKSTRLIASKINEDSNLGQLSQLPGKKSLNLRVFLNTLDTRVSPVIDTDRISVILTSNRINKVIDDYSIDRRVNVLGLDPTAFQYISKEMSLATPATSIKIILDAHINNYCDIRAFYAISDSPNFVPIFTPFPGYKNLDSRGEVISLEKNDGSSDQFVLPSSSFGFESSNIEYKEYGFTADSLPTFRNFRIKLSLSSTNHVYPPRIKNLRVITLA